MTTLAHRKRVLAYLQQQEDALTAQRLSAATRYIAPEHMPNADAGRKHWRCTDCGNRWATDFTMFATGCPCCDGDQIEEAEQ